MFYLESYNCTIYKTDPTLVKEFDYYIGSMNKELSKKIAISFIAEKLGTHFETAKQLVLYFEQCGIVERRFSIACPECGQIAKTVKESELLDTLEDVNESPFCIGCEREDILFSTENIYLLFERMKTSTASQDEINKTLIERKIISNIITSNESFFSKADLLDADNICDLFFKPDESAYTELQTLYAALDDTYPNTVSQGAAYDKLIKRLLDCIKGISTTNVLKTDTNQIDGFSIAFVSTAYPSILKLMNPVFYSECKNEPSSAPGIGYYQKLYSIIFKSRVAKLGIIFSRKKATSDAILFGKQMFLMNETVIININDADWDKIINGRANFLKYLQIRYSEILSFANESIDLVNEMVNN